MSNRSGLETQVVLALWGLSLMGAVPALEKLIGDMSPEAAIESLRSWVGNKFACPDEVLEWLVLAYFLERLDGLGSERDDVGKP